MTWRKFGANIAYGPDIFPFFCGLISDKLQAPHILQRTPSSARGASCIAERINVLAQGSTRTNDPNHVRDFQYTRMLSGTTSKSLTCPNVLEVILQTN